MKNRLGLLRLGIFSTLLLIIVFVLSASAYAEDLKYSLKAKANVQGIYYENKRLASDNTVDYSYIEMDVQLKPKITYENTSLNMFISVHDETWKDPTLIDVVTDINDDGTYDTTTLRSPVDDDENVKFEQIWIEHKFSEKICLEAGLMPANTWGTDFNDKPLSYSDDEDERYKLQLTYGLSTSLPVELHAAYEKLGENGSDRREDAEKDDGDAFELGATISAGNITIQPMVHYENRSDADLNQSDDGYTRTAFYLALSGSFDNIGFEAELVSDRYAFDDYVGAPHDDFSLLGYYANVWTKLNGITVGALYAYGSFDEDEQVGLDLGDDFDSTYLLGDGIRWGRATSDSACGDSEDLYGMSVAKIYAEQKFLDKKLTIKPEFAYVMSNQKDNFLEDATAWEFDLFGAYKISKKLTYYGYAGYADVSYDVAGVEDPEPAYKLAHKLEFKF